MVLSAVCREWRDIALTTPLLWSKLELRFDEIGTSFDAESGFLEGTINRWLTRAGNCPLSLDFDLSGLGGEPFPLGRLREILHRWAHRVQYLWLDIGAADIRPLRLDSAPFPLLP
ncbi:hypothetical protein K438DRAFT_2148861, partial [Mycena galopus ATCC 62051]